MTKKPPQRAAINRKYSLLDATDDAFHPGFLRTFAPRLQHSRAHQWSQCQGNYTGSENRDDDRDGELTKYSSNQSSHKHQRNKHCRQRNGHRHDRETDFLRAVNGGLKWLLTTLHTTYGVLQ